MTDQDTARSPRRASITAIADATHTGRGRAAEILKAAGMRRDRAGTYLFDKACETITALLDPARSVGHVAGGDDSALSDGVAGNVAALSGAKAQYEVARTRRLQIEIAKLEGRLVERDAVTALARDLAVHVRSGLSGVGARTAADLAATNEPAKAQAIVDQAIHDALTRLSAIDSISRGISRMTAAVAAAFLGALNPPPKIAPSEWAEANLVLPQGVSRPGALKLTVPQRGMVDAVAEPDAKVVVFMTAAQIGKSTAIDCILANSIVNDPGPTLYVAPDESAAHSYVRDRLDKLIAATPALRTVVGAGAKGVDSKDAKSFPGGELHTASSFKPTDLAARSIRLVCQDEIDRFCVSLPGGEGDPVAAAIKRTTAWRNAVTILSSTPTFKATSRVAAWYERSDKRLFHVTCPACGVVAALAKERIAFHAGKPEAARLQCLDCGEATDEAGRLNMIRGGSWIATAEGEKGVIGFHANSLISEMESLASIAANIDAAKTPDQRRVLTNTTFGEPFESLSEIELQPSELQARAIPLAAPYPKAIDFVVAGVDCQTNRLECSYAGVNKATGAKWILDHVVLNGDTSGAAVWADLDVALARTFEVDGGRAFPISAALVDSGFNTGMVVSFVSGQRAKGRRVFASKGVSGFHRQPIVEGAKNRGATHRVMLLGIDGLKINVTKGLTLSVGLPNAIATPNHLQSDYWAQLAAERLDTKITNRGFPRMEWIKTPNQNNEAFDCAVMCCAAALLVKRPAPPANAPKKPATPLAERIAAFHKLTS